MVNALKKMDKKFLIFAGIIIFLPLLIIVFLAVVQGCGNSKISYESYETKMLSAGERYAEETNKVPTDEGELLTVKLSTLVDKGYIKNVVPNRLTYSLLLFGLVSNAILSLISGNIKFILASFISMVITNAITFMLWKLNIFICS